MADSTIDLNRVVVAAVAGDSTALNTVLSEVRPLIWRYCRSRIGRPDRSAVSVDDVAQEILMAVVKAIPSYENVGRPFLAFVYGIARNKVADAHRAATRNRADPVETLPDTLEVGDGPEAILMADEQSKRMAELLAVLPAKQREIIRLRIVLGLSAEDTAAAVGSTAGAVRVAQHRALNKLRGHPLLRQLTE
ncbi:MAG: RNA polymerase sigma factor ShbA [Sciscionella sp.]